MMKMTPRALILGSMLVFWASLSLSVVIPLLTIREVPPSEIWQPWTELEQEGWRHYADNGCAYCHSRYTRVVDWGINAMRISRAGDYHRQRPVLFGTERTGPDLSQEGGLHPDDWHLAHFINPRYTSPVSVMPAWEFLGREKIRALTAFVQSEGGTMADERVARQRLWRERAIAAHRAGPDANFEWLHGHIPAVWRMMPNPYPPDEAALAHAKEIYQEFCINCHGPMGDGMGRAAPHLDPPPLNFTTLRRHLEGGRYLGGIIYYQIMNGITGTAMPYFKIHLESEKIWDLSNYIGINFVGYTDADIAPEGVDASYEPDYLNPFRLPDPEGEQPELLPRLLERKPQQTPPEHHRPEGHP